MGTRDPRIDAYIAKSAAFARPILYHLRELVHATCPAVVETTKWSMPHFEYKGMLCGMSAFKEHCGFGFWKGKLVVDTGTTKSLEGMGQFGRITSIKDLPPKRVLAGYIRQAMKLNEAGIKPVRPPKHPKPKLVVPAILRAALAKNRKASAAFDAFPPSHQREYVEWIVEAKGEDTRARRLATTIEWLAEGKSRNWKYQNC